MRDFLENSLFVLFCAFLCIITGFGGPWDMLWIFFLIAIFILSKECFWPKKSTKDRFSKKALAGIDLFVIDSYQFLEGLGFNRRPVSRA